MSDRQNKTRVYLDSQYVQYVKKITGQKTATAAIEQLLEMLAKGQIAEINKGGDDYVAITRQTQEKAKRIKNRSDWRSAILAIVYDFLDRYPE